MTLISCWLMFLSFSCLPHLCFVLNIAVSGRSCPKPVCPQVDPSQVNPSHIHYLVILWIQKLKRGGKGVDCSCVIGVNGFSVSCSWTLVLAVICYWLKISNCYHYFWVLCYLFLEKMSLLLAVLRTPLAPPH